MDKGVKHFLIMAGSTNHMLMGDKLLKDNGIKTSLVPAPAEYGSVCAIAIKVEDKDIDISEKYLRENDISIRGIYEEKPERLTGLIDRLKNSIIRDEFLDVLKKIEDGQDLTHSDIVLLLKTDRKGEMEALFKAADEMRKKIIGDVVDIRGAIEFSNHCKKDCKYCGVRRNLDGLQRYRMTEDEIMEVVHSLHNIGIKTVILQSGEDAWWTSDRIANLITRIKKETGMKITLSLGERPREDYEYFKKLGANNYLLKIETTNEEIFNFIHPDDDINDRKECSQWLKELGYLNGSGCIIGLPGQREEDIANDILYFKDMGINMIGIGPFIPAKGTPLENYPTGDVDMTLKAVAVTRLVCKRVFLPATTALASIDSDLQSDALKAGANTIMLINTPAKYRYNYQIYSDKNMVDLKSAYDAVTGANREFPSYLKIDMEVYKDAGNTEK